MSRRQEITDIMYEHGYNLECFSDNLENITKSQRDKLVRKALENDATHVKIRLDGILHVVQIDTIFFKRYIAKDMIAITLEEAIARYGDNA